MNDQQINVAIAEACGWIKFWQQTGEHESIGHSEWHRGNQNLRTPPAYCTDLNAMAEAEKTLDEVRQRMFAMKLHELTDAGATFGRGLNYWTVIHTAARQRSEAFLRTLNLWRDH